MNPEFRRQLWLGFSPTRLIVLPMLLLACFGAAWLTIAKATAYARFPSVLYTTGAVLFAVLVWGMGTFAAGASVTDEMTDRTWDQQRMSAMRPWAMTWGKLGGASAFAWYGGALCLLVAVPAAFLDGQGHRVLPVALSVIFFGLSLQALVMAVNLQSLKSGETKARRGIAAILAVLFFSGLTPLFAPFRESTVTWWGQPFNNLNFVLASVALLATCALVSAWRSMAEVLAVRQMPWGWAALALIITVYLTGFAPKLVMETFSFLGMAVCSGLTFFALLTEPQPRPLWQRVVTRLSAGQWRAALLQLPRWPTTLLLAVPFALLTWASLNQSNVQPWLSAEQIQLNPIAFLLLMVRDCALLLYFAFAINNRRVVASFLLLMVVLYGLLPWLVGAFNSPILLGLVQPLLAKSSLAVAAAAVHAALALALLRWRWRATAP